jgi:hypothetical protein
LPGADCQIGICPRGCIKGEKGTFGDRRSDLGKEDAKAGLEDVGAEAFGVTAKYRWIPFNALKARDGFGQVFRLLRSKKRPVTPSMMVSTAPPAR